MFEDCNLNDVENLQSSTWNDLENKLFAVHVTNYLPIDGKQVTHSTFDQEEYPELQSLKKLPPHRITLHWCLGRVVPKTELIMFNHETNTEEFVNANIRKYAIVTPVKNLFPQLVNIYINDTFIIGDYKLSNKDTIIVPIDTDPKSFGDATIKYYDPKKTNLEFMVNAFIKLQNGYTVINDITTASSSEGDEWTHYKLNFNGISKTINKTDPSLFHKIIEKLNISFGQHCFSLLGWQGGYLCSQEEIIGIIILLIASREESNLNLEQLNFLRNFTKHAHECLINWIEKTQRFSEDVKQKFISHQEKLMIWYKLIDLEIFLIEKHNLTLMEAEKFFINNLLEKLHEPLAELSNYTSENKTYLKKREHTNKDCPCYFTYSCLSKIPIEDFLYNYNFNKDIGLILLYVLFLSNNDRNHIITDNESLRKLSFIFNNIFLLLRESNNLSKFQKIIEQLLFNIERNYNDENNGSKVISFFKSTPDFLRYSVNFIEENLPYLVNCINNNMYECIKSLVAETEANSNAIIFGYHLFITRYEQPTWLKEIASLTNWNEWQETYNKKNKDRAKNGYGPGALVVT